jgi:hypothetical protein
MDSIQKYWTIYLRSLSFEIQKEFDSDIQRIMDEINHFLGG